MAEAEEGTFPAPEDAPRDRFVTSNGLLLTFPQPIVADPEHKPGTWLAQYAGLPRWLAHRWVETHGLQKAAARAYHLNAPPGIGLRTNVLKSTPKQLIADLAEIDIPADQPFPKEAPEILRVTRPRVVINTDFFRDGRY